MIKRYRKNPDEKALKTGYYPRFDEFLQFVAEERPHGHVNKHWQRISELCSFCHVKFDFVGTYETLKEDTKYILRHILAKRGNALEAFPDKIMGPTSARHNFTTSLSKMYSNISENVLAKIRDIYLPDFELFCYNKYAV